MNKENKKYLKFIRNFSSIKVSTICKDLKIDNSNFYKNGKKADEIKKEIDKRIIDLYKKFLEEKNE